MGRVEFISKILTKVESLQQNVICYAYQEKFGGKSVYNICVSDYDIYTKDERFKRLTKAWHLIAKNMNLKIIFWYCSPLEKNLVELMEADNLIMNV